MTAELMREMVAKHEMVVDEQIDKWGDQKQHDLEVHHDVITVFRKPALSAP